MPKLSDWNGSVGALSAAILVLNIPLTFQHEWGTVVCSELNDWAWYISTNSIKYYIFGMQSKMTLDWTHDLWAEHSFPADRNARQEVNRSIISSSAIKSTILLDSILFYVVES